MSALSGTLLSLQALDATALATVSPSAARGAHVAHAEWRSWHAKVRAELGPTASARTVFDVVAAPVCARLGLGVDAARPAKESIRATLTVDGRRCMALVTTAWGQDAGAEWRNAVRDGIAHDVRWCICVTGPAFRLFDAHRAYSRRYAEFDLAAAIDDPAAFAALWCVLSREGQRQTPCALERAVAITEAHRKDVRVSLEAGVRDALTTLLAAFRSATTRRRLVTDLFDESLTVVYRVLFLLFAEARGLVPLWHPVYAASYSVASVRTQANSTEPPAGLWETLQAIARLAHRGCRAGTLSVPPFNGRLFSPAHAPLADTLPLDDRAVKRAVGALTVRSSAAGPQQIAYGELGVEQLGGIYEQLLDFQSPGSAARRKATGTFYTPRSLTEFVVRRTLAPLTTHAASDAILSLRVLDPAMGSGAFLVAAGRFLAAEYEAALVREGVLSTLDVTMEMRADFRRTVAQRCLYGVDANAMAVQLARLSLWLATLARDKPLTFLDHHLRAGNSILGARIEDVISGRRPGGRTRPSADLPLFSTADFDRALAAATRTRTDLAQRAGDTLEQVREKERALTQLNAADGPLSRWKTAADVWCAAWFQTAANRVAFTSLLDETLRGHGPLPSHLSQPMLREAREIAGRHQFFHWALEFPEVFQGEPPGFDAILGNPPWEMLRNDGAEGRHSDVVAFTRGSGLFHLQGDGHANLYQLFFERALALTRTGGRVGLVLPSGIAGDRGSASLRRHVFDRTSVDTFTVLDNRHAIFPIHRGVKFVLLTLTNSGSTGTIPLRTGISSPSDLDAIADTPAGDERVVPMTRVLIERVSGPELAMPDVATRTDLAILSRLVFAHPPLGDPSGWNAHFGRELNATDDKAHFTTDEGLPVIEGKHLHPFRVEVGESQQRLPARVARRVLPARPFERVRLGYREVAAATNRLTLIAAMIPAGVVTTHTVFCLKEPLAEDDQYFLCGMLNSYVANYLVRMRVTTHVTAGIMERLPMPRPPHDSTAAREVRALARGFQLAGLKPRPTTDLAARLQALAAHLYGLDALAFERILETFPLIDTETKREALEALRYIFI